MSVGMRERDGTRAEEGDRCHKLQVSEHSDSSAVATGGGGVAGD